MGVIRPAGGPVTVGGALERVTYADAATAFAVVHLKPDDRPGTITLVGTLPAPVVGERITATGRWEDHPAHGRQLRMEHCERSVPVTRAGIREYLGSGMIAGLGPKTAERIVRRFGADTLAILDAQIERLSEVPGIGAKRAAAIAEAWAAQGRQRALMLFLQSHGIGAGLAMRIFKAYGDAALDRVRSNPFQMAVDIRGVGFATADAIAQKLGIPPEAPERIQAGLLHVLTRAVEAGHTHTPATVLTGQVRSLLGVGEDSLIYAAIAAVARQERIVVEAPLPDLPDRAVYLRYMHRAEAAVAARWHELTAAPAVRSPGPAVRALDRLAVRLGFDLADAQRRAVLAAVTGSATIITGGPGTGKTTIVRAIAALADSARRRVLLAAPTGRAARRLTEATGNPAQTLHRLLEYQHGRGGFQRHSRRPLDGDLIVVDEASMIDTVLMAALLEAVPPGGAVVLVGDRHQLPSVGPGQVLRDMIAAKTAPVVALTEIFRQARTSRIVVNAHRIQQGDLPLADTSSDRAGDFYFIENDSPEAVADVIVQLVRHRIPRRFGVDPVDDIQVISPMHRGVVGVRALNHALAAALNADGGLDAPILAGLRAGDKVMQMRNNYDRELFNGDIGRVLDVDTDRRRIRLRFDDRVLDLPVEDIEDIAPAYAVTVHKAQGSEYPVVVMPLTTGHYMMLERNLLYTAVTRARRLVVLVGSRKALAMAVGNRSCVKRRTRLYQRLVGLDHRGGLG